MSGSSLSRPEKPAAIGLSIAKNWRLAKMCKECRSWPHLPKKKRGAEQVNLYEIHSRIAAILDTGIIIDDETGEVLSDVSDLESLQMEFEEKLENTICYYKNLKAEAMAIRQEEQALAARRKANENRATSLERYIQSCMSGSGLQKFETPRCKASLTHSKSVEIADDVFFALAPEEYVRVKKEADKAAIKKAIGAGADIPGACIVENERLTIK